MVSINKIGHKIEKGTRSFVSEMSKGGYAPIILLEGTVIAGRTYQAKKRGGYTEARERLTEESLGAAFWLGGVAGFNKLGDIVGKNILKLKDVNFEVGQDHARKPFQNYITKVKKEAQQTINFEKLEKNLAKFKFAKIITSVVLANAFMGIIVPKVNQAITKKQLAAKKNTTQPPNQNLMAKTSFEEFVNKANGKKKNISFNGLSLQGLLNATTMFEQNATVKLLSTDVGTSTGRSINARNKHERTEILFRDLSSMYFYYCCRKHLNSTLNFIEDGKTTRLDPATAKQLDSHIRTGFMDGNYTVEEFEKLVLGDKNARIPEKLQTKLQVPEETVKEINAKYKDVAKANAQIKAQTKIISLKDFEEIVGKDSTEAKIARRMSRLQPELPTGAILTESQVKDVYTKGLINEPRFLNKVYRQSTKKASSNPTKFVAEKDLLSLKEEMVDYVADIAKKAKKAGKEINLDTLTKANKQNFVKNAFNLGAGFAVSAVFLSTVIPKVQYWITKKQTGQDKFPGVE